MLLCLTLSAAIAIIGYVHTDAYASRKLRQLADQTDKV